MGFVSEVSAKLTADNSEFKSTLQESANEAGKFGSQLAGKLGDKLTGMKDISHALATAIGLDYKEIAESVALFFIGSSKVAEEALKKTAELSKEIADTNIKAMQLNNSEEQKYQQLLKDQSRLLQEIDAIKKTVNTQDVAAYDARRGVHRVTIEIAQTEEQRLQIAEKEKQLAEINLQQQEHLKQVKKGSADEEKKDRADIAKLEDDTSESQRKVAMARLSLVDREAEIRGEINELENLLTDGSLEESKVAETRNRLAERRKELGETIVKIGELDKKNNEAIAASEDKQSDAARAKLPLVKQHAQLTAEIAESEAEVDDLLDSQLDATDAIKRTDDLRAKQREVEKKLDEGMLLTRDKLAKLSVDELEKQAKLIETRLEGADAEEEITEQLEDELDLVNEIIAAKKKELAVSVNIARTGNSYDDQSTSALQGSLARLKAQIDPRGDTPGAYSSGNDAIFGAYLGNQAVRPEIKAIEDLLKRREEIQKYDTRYGEEATRRQYGDDATDKALKYMSDSATRTTNAIEEINMRLKKYFPQI